MNDLIYVCGKISGLTEKEYRANFDEACRVVNSTPGMEAINPLDIRPNCRSKDAPRGCNSSLVFEDGTYQHTWQCYMKADIKALVDCQGIFVQTNAEDSRGAMLELSIASSLGMLVIFSDGNGGMFNA